MASHTIFMLCVGLAAVYGDDSGCLAQHGTCQEEANSCSGGYVSGLCAGHASRRCCLPSGDDSGCLAQHGTCQEEANSCSGGYVSGLCAGHSSRRCCLPSGGGGCSNIHIISRSQWGARAPKSTTTMPVPVHEFFIHHTEGPSCTDISHCSSVLRGIQNYHMDTRHWSDIGYSFLIGEDGNVYEGRGWTHVGAHTENYNRKGFAASFMGNYMTHIPGSKALTAVNNLIACGIQLGKISPDYRLYGHRDTKATSCPGDALYREIQTWSHYSHVHP